MKDCWMKRRKAPRMLQSITTVGEIGYGTGVQIPRDSYMDTEEENAAQWRIKNVANDRHPLSPCLIPPPTCSIDDTVLSIRRDGAFRE